MANSGTVGPQSLVLYTQYNNIRSDVLDITTGHNHSGSTDCGRKLSGSAFNSGSLGTVTTGTAVHSLLAAGSSAEGSISVDKNSFYIGFMGAESKSGTHSFMK